MSAWCRSDSTSLITFAWIEYFTSAFLVFKDGLMLISVEKNFIFIHVAKTGGQSMKEALRPYAVKRQKTQWRRLLSHLPVPEDVDVPFGPHVSAWWMKLKLPREFFDRAFKFAFVRNPYDLAVSRYAFVRDHPEHHRHPRLRKRDFAACLREERRRSLIRRHDQTAALCDPRGRLLVDKVYRFEEIEAAFADIAGRLELGEVPKLSRRNASRRRDYRSYYGAAERKLVEQIWKRDFQKFGHSF